MDYYSEKTALVEFCEQRGHCRINDATYEACASFLFYTSWFEELLFNVSDRQCSEKNKKNCEELFEMIDLSKYDFFGNFCSNRYITKTGTSHYFSNLKLNQADKEPIAQSLLLYKTNHTYSWKLLWSYLMIVYRFRNNMFHGSKGLINLNLYEEQFRLLNRFMRQMISDIDDNNYKGYNV